MGAGVAPLPELPSTTIETAPLPELTPVAARLAGLTWGTTGTGIAPLPELAAVPETAAVLEVAAGAAVATIRPGLPVPPVAAAPGFPASASLPLAPRRTGVRATVAPFPSVTRVTERFSGSTASGSRRIPVPRAGVPLFPAAAIAVPATTSLVVAEPSPVPSIATTMARVVPEPPVPPVSTWGLAPGVPPELPGALASLIASESARPPVVPTVPTTLAAGGVGTAGRRTALVRSTPLPGGTTAIRRSVPAGAIALGPTVATLVAVSITTVGPTIRPVRRTRTATIRPPAIPVPGLTGTAAALISSTLTSALVSWAVVPWRVVPSAEAAPGARTVTALVAVTRSIPTLRS